MNMNTNTNTNTNTDALRCAAQVHEGESTRDKAARKHLERSECNDGKEDSEDSDDIDKRRMASLTLQAQRLSAKKAESANKATDNKLSQLLKTYGYLQTTIDTETDPAKRSRLQAKADRVLVELQKSFRNSCGDGPRV
jgi:hypothetical protein